MKTKILLIFLLAAIIPTASAMQSQNYEIDSTVEQTTSSNYSINGYLGPSGILLGNYSMMANIAYYGNIYPSIIPQPPTMCGDVNCDDTIDISDVILLLYYVGYPGQYELCNDWAGDVTGDGSIDISDVIRELYYVGYPGQYELNCR